MRVLHKPSLVGGRRSSTETKEKKEGKKNEGERREGHWRKRHSFRKVVGREEEKKNYGKHLRRSEMQGEETGKLREEEGKTYREKKEKASGELIKI